MSIAARADLFGEPTDSLVPEAIWAFKRDENYWPFWDDAVDFIAEWRDCEPDDAEEMLLDAIRNEEVIPRLRVGGRTWGVELDTQTADRIARRYMDVAMPRQDEEENW
jgi:hypothetical protein